MPSSASPATPTTPATPKESFRLPDGQIRSHKSDGVKFEDVTDDKRRNKALELVYDALVWDADAPSDLVLARAKSIESTIHNDTIKDTTKKSYSAKMRTIVMNAKDKKNPGLREAIVSGDLPVKKFCNMTPAEMASEERKAQDQRLVEQNLFNTLGAGNTHSETDMFQCGKCKKKRTTYYQMQTRSADEPMTTFVTCLACNHRWKFS